MDGKEGRRGRDGWEDEWTDGSNGEEKGGEESDATFVTRYLSGFLGGGGEC